MEKKKISTSTQVARNNDLDVIGAVERGISFPKFPEFVGF